MDTSNNPFATDSVPYQKPSLLLDLDSEGDVYKQNGTSSSDNNLFFMNRPENGRGNFDDDDFGPETDVDAVDDVLLSPTKLASSASNNNPFEDKVEENTTIDAGLELQQEQISNFDFTMKVRETPTPPADQVPGDTNTVPELDNVAESGDDSEDEWNYYRVDPSTDQQPAQQTCQKSGQQSEEEANMESQLNPDAAEFVPSPTQTIPPLEDILLAESPKKAIPMEDISIPTDTEFHHEATQRPSELGMAEHNLMFQEKISKKLPDLVSSDSGVDNFNSSLPPGAICGKSIRHLENGNALTNFLEQGDSSFQELQSSIVQDDNDVLLDESEVSSTKEVLSDESAMTFMTSERQEILIEGISTSTFCANEEILKTEIPSDELNSEFNKEFEFSEKHTSLDDKKGFENIVPMSFELQKELIPEMELKPERVQLESESTSSFEQDKSSSSGVTDDSLHNFSNQKTTLDINACLKAESGKEETDTSAIGNMLDNPPLFNQDKLLFTAEESIFSPSSKSQEDSPHSPNRSLQSPSQSPDLSKPELTSDQSQELLKQFQSASKSPVLQELQSQHSPLLSPTVDSLLAPCTTGTLEIASLSSHFEEQGGIDTALLSNETIPVMKNAQSPSLIDNTLLQEDNSSIFSEELKDSIVPDMESQKQGPLLESNISTECETSTVSSGSTVKHFEDSNVSQVALQTPAPSVEASKVLQDNGILIENHDLLTEKVSSKEKVDLHTEKAPEEKEIVGDGDKLVETTEAVAEEILLVSKSKKPVAASRDKKECVTDKDKTKTLGTKTTTVKMKQKSIPTSPTKPLSTSNISTPKKPLTSLTSVANKVTKVPAKSPIKPQKTSTVPVARTVSQASKATPITKPATQSYPKSNSTATAVTATKSAILSTSEAVKSSTTKRLPATSAAKPPSRPATAPAKSTTKTAAVSTSRTSTVSAPAKPRPGVINGNAAKPRVTGTVAATAARNKVGMTKDSKMVTDKQVKDTANKQISSARTITATKSATTTTTKRITGVTKSLGAGNSVKSAPIKAPIKKTGATLSKVATKTTVTVMSATENNEFVKTQEVAATVD